MADIFTYVAQLKEERKPWEADWEDLAKYIVPRHRQKAFLQDTVEPVPRTAVYDSTPVQGAEILTAALNTYLTSQSNRWFSLRARDQILNDLREVKVWLEDTENRVYSWLAMSNAYSQIHELYFDLVVFGVACMSIEEDFHDIYRFTTIPIWQTYLAENANGDVATVARIFKLTAVQAVEEFGELVGGDILKLASEKPLTKVEILHFVTSLPIGNLRSTLPVTSVYAIESKKRVLRVQGYYEMPFMVPRWMVNTGEVYGRSPAMNALPDIKMLNRMSETTIKAAQKIVDPPIMVPDDSVIGPVRLTPGGATMIRSEAMAKRVKPEPLVTTSQPQIGLDLIQDRRSSIMKAFHADLFLSLLEETKQMTATEVMQRVEERMALLGPVLGRLQRQLLKPMVERLVSIAYRRGLLMPLPPALRDTEIDIVYVSPLARAQRLYDARAIARTIGEVGMYGDPSIMDNFDMDRVALEVADLYGFPQRCLRPTAERERIRQERQAVQDEILEAQRAESQAKVAQRLKAYAPGINAEMQRAGG